MTPDRWIEVTAPSRLHFGLFSFNDPASPLQHGGVGAMIDAPGLRLRARAADEVTATGAHAERTAGLARRVLRHRDAGANGCEIEVLDAPRQHTGLGVGTQLGMSVAAAVRELLGEPDCGAADLAVASGRGRRSAIGAHGFTVGGLLVDGGRRDGDTLGRLAQRVDLPGAWRFVLVIGPAERGLASTAEQAAFASLAPPAASMTERLYELATCELAPAAREADHGRFSAALFEYGQLAGECFAAVQGGPFASPAIAERVRLIRSLGCEGCGQSSWGPTVFALTPSGPAADQLVERLRHEPPTRDCELIVASPCNTGATIMVD